MNTPPGTGAGAERISKVLREAWAKAEPGHSIALYPESCVRTFYDMACAVVEYLAAHPASGAELVPAGFVLVPREPTDTMLSEGRKAIHDSHSVRTKAQKVYAAMIAAAPAPVDGVAGGVTSQEISSLRWLLNITTEFDRKDVRTRQAAKLLDDYSNGKGMTNRQHLESLWSKLTKTGR